MSQLINVLNISSQVTALLCSSTDFFNWDTFFDKVYKRPAGGTVSKNHTFTGQLESLGILVTEDVCGIDRAEQNLNRLKKNSTGQERGGRTRTVGNCTLNLEKRPGLREIKQVELYETWGPLLPAEFRNNICAKPSDAVIATVKEARKAKRNAKKAQNDRIRARKAEKNNGKRTAASKKTCKKTAKAKRKKK